MRAPSAGFALKMYAQFLPPRPFKCPWIHLSEIRLLGLNALKKMNKRERGLCVCSACVMNARRRCPFSSVTDSNEAAVYLMARTQNRHEFSKGIRHLLVRSLGCWIKPLGWRNNALRCIQYKSSAWFKLKTHPGSLFHC